MPSEPTPNPTSGYLRGAQAAAFRLFTLYLGLGIVDLVFTWVRSVVALNTDVHTESAFVAPLIGFMSDSRLGEGWLLSFLLLAVVSLGVKVGIAAWVWRRRGAVIGQPIRLLLVGVCGLFAMIAQPFAAMQTTYVLGRTHGAEALGALAMASNISSMAAMLLNVLMLGGFLAVIFFPVQADQEPREPQPQRF